MIDAILRETYRFTEADLRANRKGHLIESQRKRFSGTTDLLVAVLIFFAFGGIGGAMFVLVAVEQPPGFPLFMAFTGIFIFVGSMVGLLGFAII